MKKVLRKAFLLMVIIGILFSAMTGVNAEETETQSGVDVVISTDKDAYSSGEDIRVSVNIKNTNTYDVSNVSISMELSEGLSLKEGDLFISDVNIKSEETYIKEIVAIKEKAIVPNDSPSDDSKTPSDKPEEKPQVKPTDNTKNNSSIKPATDNSNNKNNETKKAGSPQTGDNSNILIWILLIGATITCVYFAVKLRKKAAKLLSLILGIVLILTAVPTDTFATEAGLDDISIITSKTFTVDGDISSVSVKVSFKAPESPILESDVDGDKVPDYIEEYFGTDVASDDTDKDGLSDYIEIYKTKTDPNLIDTDNNGINDGDEDSDKDGLSNLNEISIGTDVAKPDSDSDGITDGEEVNVYHTDPLKYDTDEDGANDGWEIENGFDPLTFNQGFEIEIKSEETMQANGVEASVVLSATGEQVSSLEVRSVSQNEEPLLSESIPGYLGTAYDFSIDGDITSATIIFRYDPSLGKISDEFQPTIYYFNEESGVLEELENQTAKDGEVSAVVTHFSKYILLNRVEFDKVWDNEIKPPLSSGNTDNEATLDIVFVIDYSASMDDNDPNQIFKSLSEGFINKLRDGKDKAGAVKFIRRATLVSELTTEKDSVITSINNITYDSGYGSYSGTDGSTGIKMALDELYTSDSMYQYIVFITDGEDNGYTYSYDELISNANELNVVIYTIGMGSASESVLRKVANETGGKYYHATVGVSVDDITDLNEVFNDIQSETIDLTTDSNNDKIPDYYNDLIKDGILLLSNGSSEFAGIDFNYNEDGTFGNDYDGDGIINGDEICLVQDGSVVYLGMKSDPTLKDTDYDGRKDNEDAAPKNNRFKGVLKTDYTNCDVVTYMDYRWFFDDNTIYNQPLSVMSSLLASSVYGNPLELVDSTGLNISKEYDLKSIMTALGLEQPDTISIQASDNHVSEVGLGYRTVKYNGLERTVLAVIVRGTNGTIKEWSSNFDIGEYATFDSSSDWKTPENHKGFDIAANRILKIVDQYVSGENLNASNLTYWVMGHSRGAAIANILGAYLEDNNRHAFTYTFAAPFTTLRNRSDASNYNSIFNLVNTDDFVPRLPMEAWGYTRYGRTANVSLASNYEKEWETRTGERDYDWDSLGLEDTVSAFSRVLSGDPRIDSYTYTCKDHGDGSRDNITAQTRLLSKDIHDARLAKIPENALPYCKITRYETGIPIELGFDVCQTPAYFMQILAAKMANEIDNYTFVVELDVAPRYQEAKFQIISSAIPIIGGITHPHYTESYYVLAVNVPARQFK